MKIAGEHRMTLPPSEIWDGIHDLNVLRKTVPGCQELEQTGRTTYRGSATVGIAMIKGLYQGNLTILEESEPHSLRIAVEARSGHAEISGIGSLEIEQEGDVSVLRYEGDAHIKGPLAVVGQRLLPSGAKTITAQFFKNLEAELRASVTEEA